MWFAFEMVGVDMQNIHVKDILFSIERQFRGRNIGVMGAQRVRFENNTMVLGIQANIFEGRTAF